MKKNVLFRAVVTIVMMLIGIMPAMAYDFELGGIYYNITSSEYPYTVEVTYKDTDYNSYSGNIVLTHGVIYDHISYSITSIGSSAFRNCTELKSIEMQDEVVSIGTMSFYGCSNLSEIILPNSVQTIGNSAFGNSGLAKITLPKSLLTMGNSVFSLCKQMESIVIPNSVTSIGIQLFVNCSNLIDVELSSSIQTIGEKTFFNCSKLESVTIPSSVTNISGDAFAGCSALKEIIFEDSENELELGYQDTSKGLFYGCPIESVYLGRNITYSSNEGYTYGYSPFYGKKTISKIEISDNVTSILQYCFFGAGVTELNIPNSVTGIGEKAFNDCESLNILTIGENVSSLVTGATGGSSIFDGCSEIKKIYFNAKDCSTVKLWYGEPQSTKRPFDSCASNVESVVFGEHVWAIRNGLCRYFTNIKEIVIPKEVVTIEVGAFSGCNSLATVTSENPLPTNIDYGAFESATYNTATLIIPQDSEHLYEVRTGWKEFLNKSVKESAEAHDPVEMTISHHFGGKVHTYVPYGESQTYRFSPIGGWVVHSATFNGVDITEQIVDNTYTTPIITEASELIVSYENMTEINELSENDNVKVIAHSDIIKVTGTAIGELIQVYNTNGVLISSCVSNGEIIECPVLQGHTYVVKTANHRIKVLL